jgi:hypothetical protein
MTNVFNDPFNFSIVPSRLQRTVLENHTVGSFMNLKPCCITGGKSQRARFVEAD